jgi:hypothetical protein
LTIIANNLKKQTAEPAMLLIGAVTLTEAGSAGVAGLRLAPLADICVPLQLAGTGFASQLRRVWQV